MSPVGRDKIQHDDEHIAFLHKKIVNQVRILILKIQTNVMFSKL